MPPLPIFSIFSSQKRLFRPPKNICRVVEKYPDAPSVENGRPGKEGAVRGMGLVLCLSLLLGFGKAYSDEVDWLPLESGQMKILKLYGLPVGERLTVTLFPPVVLDQRRAVDWFYQAIEEDLPRAGEIISRYQTEVTEIPGVSVITTMVRCQDGFQSRFLVHYQAFYFARQEKMWFVRTELNDNVALLIRHYGDQLGMILSLIDMSW